MSLRRRIAARLAGSRRIVVWGASGLGRAAIMRWLPTEKIVGVIDINSSRHGERIAGIAVAGPAALATLSADCIVICTSMYSEVMLQLNDLKFAGQKFYIYETMLPADGESIGHWERLCIDIAATRNTDWLRFVLLKPQIAVNVTFRLANLCAGSWVFWPFYALFFVLHSMMCVIFSIQLPIKAQIGPGLVFAHFGTIVFTARASMGAFCTIYQGVTLGSNDSGEGPVLGSFVTVYAGAKVLGRSIVGDHSRIGANAVVLDLRSGAHASIVGVPARVVARRSAAVS